MRNAIWMLAAALSGLCAVLAGTVAAHLLGSDPRAAQLLATGAQYAMYHGLALLALALLASEERRTLVAAGWLFVAGLLLFPPSLYLLALSGVRALGYVTPFGGVAFLLGWAALALEAVLRLRRR